MNHYIYILSGQEDSTVALVQEQCVYEELLYLSFLEYPTLLIKRLRRRKLLQSSAFLVHPYHVILFCPIMHPFDHCLQSDKA